MRQVRAIRAAPSAAPSSPLLGLNNDRLVVRAVAFEEAISLSRIDGSTMPQALGLGDLAGAGELDGLVGSGDALSKQDQVVTAWLRYALRLGSLD